MPATADGTGSPLEESTATRAARLRWILGPLAAALVAAALGMFAIGKLTLRATVELERCHAVLADLQAVLMSLQDAETGQRGYVLTGEAPYLEPYVAARGRLEQTLDALRARVRTGELDGADVEGIATLAHQKTAELERTIAARRDLGAEAATAIVRGGEGRRVMDALRGRLGALRERQQAALAAARSAARRWTWVRTAVFVALTLLELGFLAWVYRRILREVERRVRAGQELARARELLQVTLGSIGDGVIVTDLEGRVTFLNEVAVELTGWPAGHAVGRPSREVFRIVNESTRTPVESPVDRVLATGRVAGLANHTLLVRRDGVEVPIDDSGAPIRDAAGDVRGVVLVFRDVAAARRTHAELVAAKNEAESASRAKDHFMAVLSHELRTPLTPVLATLSAWQEGQELPEAFRADLDLVRRNVALEVRLIDDLLDMTRIASGKLALAPRPIDLHELLDGVIAFGRPAVKAKRITLARSFAAERHHAFADPERLHQVFANVLRNAVKFSPEDSTIRFETTNAANGNFEVRIVDQGIGMSPETLARVFEPFQQGSHERVRSGGGLGLGMAISRALVDALGGTLAATSEGPGKGSTFTVSLPVIAAPEAPAAPAPASPTDERPAPALRILLVEDHEDSSYAMRRILERMGHTVEVRTDVATALVALETTGFDLLLSDIGLPDGTGFELVQRLRAGSLQPDIPAIALTGFGMETDVAQARHAGFDAHLTKPIDFGRLESALRALAAGRPPART